jgi:hypothetical protein
MSASDIAVIYAPIIEAAALALTAVAACWALGTWRNEMVGRNRAKLAAETLAMFYEARDIIADVRFFGSFSDEGSTRPRIAGENEDDARYRNTIYVPVERLARHAEFFGRLGAKRYEFMAAFGRNAADPFDEIRKIKNTIPASASSLIRMHGRVGRERPDLVELQKKLEANIGWVLEGEDEIATQVDTIVDKIEQICQPAILGQLSAWQKFLRYVRTIVGKVVPARSSS